MTSDSAPHSGSLVSDSRLGSADEIFKRAVGYSIAAHVALFVVFSVRLFLFPSEPIPFERAIRVDIVGLPDKATNQLPLPDEGANTEKPKPLNKTKAPKEVSKEDNKVVLNKNKLQQQAALKRLEALEKLKSPGEESAPGKNSKNQSNKISQQIRGNQISSGSALKGIAKMNYESYQEKVHDQVNRHWNLPQWMANARLSARVRIWVDASGNILRKELTRPSAQATFDERVMKAIEAAAPLPMPPNELLGVLEVEGIEIEFEPER